MVLITSLISQFISIFTFLLLVSFPVDHIASGIKAIFAVTGAVMLLTRAGGVGKQVSNASATVAHPNVLMLLTLNVSFLTL